MKFDDRNSTINPLCVAKNGSRGCCAGCKKVSHETARFNNLFYCRSCASSKIPGNKTAIFEKTDAKFKCPVAGKKCNADNLSIDEFYVGSCCEKGSRWTQKEWKFERVTVVNKIYKESRKEENEAEIEVETAKKEVETIRKTLEAAENKAKDADDKLIEKIKWRKTVQKRALFLAKEAMTEDNSDNESDEEPRDENADEPAEREDDDNSCKVCFEKYDKIECLRATVIPCGHQSCFKCLSSLPAKNCPTCRAEFTVETLIKLY